MYTNLYKNKSIFFLFKVKDEPSNNLIIKVINQIDITKELKGNCKPDIQ